MLNILYQTGSFLYPTYTNRDINRRAQFNGWSANGIIISTIFSSNVLSVLITNDDMTHAQYEFIMQQPFKNMIISSVDIWYPPDHVKQPILKSIYNKIRFNVADISNFNASNSKDKQVVTVANKVGYIFYSDVPNSKSYIASFDNGVFSNIRYDNS